jgi:hypothetical protein
VFGGGFPLKFREARRLSLGVMPTNQMNYELWHSKNENSYLFIPRNEYYEKRAKYYKD